MEDLCVMCGAIVPEGTHVCKNCMCKCVEIARALVKEIDPHGRENKKITQQFVNPIDLPPFSE